MLFLTAYNSAERTEVNESKMMGFFRNEILLNEHCLIAQPHLTLNAVETENLIKKKCSLQYTLHNKKTTHKKQCGTKYIESTPVQIHWVK